MLLVNFVTLSFVYTVIFQHFFQSSITRSMKSIFELKEQAVGWRCSKTLLKKDSGKVHFCEICLSHIPIYFLSYQTKFSLVHVFAVLLILHFSWKRCKFIFYPTYFYLNRKLLNDLQLLSSAACFIVLKITFFRKKALKFFFNNDI